jgi:hypothetical protein
MANQSKIRIGQLDYISLVDGASIADDGTVALTLTGITQGLLFASYETAAGAEYSASYLVYMSNDTLAILIQDNTTDFDDADTDAKFDVYSNSGTITVKNRTAATVTANIIMIAYGGGN